MTGAAAVGLICGLLAFIVAAVCLYYHSAWAMRARFCKDWEQQAERYAQSLKRMHQIAEAEGELPPQLVKFYEYMCETDRQSIARCAKLADNWRRQIPRRLRRRFGVDA